MHDVDARGTVWFIGAGPGAADLITLRGARLLREADCVLYDALVDGDTLALAERAVKIPVGKRGGRVSTEQAFIDRLLVSSARRYARVVRLKGGDPSLFGRLDEELAALDAAGIAYEIVPGVTAACAAAAAIGRPLTQRGVSRSVMLATPAIAPHEAEPEWLKCPKSADTLALYMAARNAADTARRLLEQGWPRDTPVAVVRDASLPTQDVSITDLIGLAIQPLPACDAPTLLLIGRSLANASTACDDEKIAAGVGWR